MYVLGIDAGTEAIKAGVFDLSGHLIASGSRSYTTHFPRPGWAEQDPDEWWAGMVGAVRDCLAKANLPADSIRGLSADATTCTLLPIKADGRHLRRALLWMDVRATEQAARIFASDHPALRYSLAGVSAEWMPGKILWLKENEPDTFANTDYFIEFTDWLAYRLTGQLALNLNTIVQRWYYHPHQGGWPVDFYETIGLGGIEQRFPTDIVPIGAPTGSLSAEAAEALGLPAGIPVAMGGGDAFVGLLGLGVVEPGDLGVVTGSSNVLSGLAADEVHFKGIFGSFPEALVPGLNLIEGGQVSTGSILNWFKRNFAGGLAAEAEASGTSIYRLLDEEAAQVPVGSDGLIVLDYFQGNRTPHTDSLARGVVMGLSLATGRAHVFRAIMEGIAYGMKDILDTYEANDCDVRRVIACGGATQSPLFMQIYADVIGKTIYTTRVAEASLLGSAVAAAHGAGLFPTLGAASRAMVEISGEYQPDGARHAQYQFYAGKYRDVYQQLRPVMHDVARHVMK
ncbi:MAG: xylulose kinase [Anaerolineae bacterium]|nr:xylulose kinase [Anaerolineae bacterium]